MTEIRKLADSVRKVAWGYLLMYLHIKINGFDLLPDWLGWILFWFAVQGLKTARPKIVLLEGFTVVLGILEVVQWLPFWETPDWLGIVSVTMTVVHIYFDFQLLTELAGLAQDRREELGGVDHSSGLLHARTVAVVLRTCFIMLTCLPIPEEVLTIVVVIITFVQIGFAFVMVANLFELAKCIDRLESFDPEI